MDEKKIGPVSRRIILLHDAGGASKSGADESSARKRRIAKGAGVDISEVNRLIKQFEQSRKMMKQMPGMMGGKGKRGRFKLPF